MNFHCYKYQLPFQSPLQNSKKTFKNRAGFILEYTDKKVHCLAEAAPLPGYSLESLHEVEQFLFQHKDVIQSTLSAEDPVDSLNQFFKQSDKPLASAQFGLDSLAYQVAASRKKQSLQQYLFTDPKQNIPVNALISLYSENLFDRIKKHLTEGFNTIKFKIGISFSDEFKTLQKIRAEFPDLTIRVDANQSWSIDEAQEHCVRLSTLNIEYCEEPLFNNTPKNLETLSRACDLPLALDESIIKKSYWPNLLPFTSYIILKPMLLGKIKTIFETKRFADTHDNKTIFTTSLESAIGRKITAVLASGLGSAESAHGLATGSLLAQDICSESNEIKNGSFDLGSDECNPGTSSHQIQQVTKSVF